MAWSRQKRKEERGGEQKLKAEVKFLLGSFFHFEATNKVYTKIVGKSIPEFTFFTIPQGGEKGRRGLKEC